MVLLIIATTLLCICSILLILSVFLQNPKDHGNTTSGLGVGMQQMIGVAQTSSVLERVTYGLGLIVFVLTLFISFTIHQRHTNREEHSVVITQLEKYAQEKGGK